MVSTFTWRQVTQATKRQANSGVKKGRKVKAVKARKPDRVEKPEAPELTRASSTPSTVAKPRQSTMASNTSAPFIVRFYGEGAKDFRNRTLAAILDYDDRALETKHDYIQILFPLPEGSMFNHEAPLITQATREAFLASPELRSQLVKAFKRMANFYGFDLVVHDEKYCFLDRPSAPASDTWLTSMDHNHLRITRIIRCLRILGLEPLAHAFHEALIQTDAGRSVSNTSLKFWDRAANRPLHLPPDVSNEDATGVVWLRDDVPA